VGSGNTGTGGIVSISAGTSTAPSSGVGGSVLLNGGNGIATGGNVYLLSGSSAA
ncbi:unnamed protein product, partial [Aphanomyces euteiches]